MTALDPWCKANKLIHQLAEHKSSDSLYVTIVPSKLIGAGTFASDNWIYLLKYWNEFMALADTSDPEISCVLVIRQFTNMKAMDQNIPLKRVAAAVLYPFEIAPISGDEFKKASSFDSETGAPIKVEASVSYINFKELARQLKLTI